MSAAIAHAKHSLHARHVAFYLALASDTSAHAAKLFELAVARKKEGPVKDALICGYRTTTDETLRHIKTLTSMGGLLFYGQQRAVSAARAIHEESRKC